MTETTADALAQVTELDEERRRYEGWLTQLDERRGSAPEHVLARVRGDYETRLRQVVERIGSHAELLRSAVAELGQRVSELRGEEQRCSDERAEGELRAAVGEYEPDRWREIESRTEATMADLVAERQQVEGELTRLQQVLQLASPDAAQDGAIEVGAAGEVGTTGAPDSGSAAVAGEQAPITPTGAIAADIPLLHEAPAIGSAEHDAWAGPSRDAPPAESAASAQRSAEPPLDAASWTSGLGIGGLSGRGALGASPAGGGNGDPQPASRPTGLSAESGSPQVKTLRCQECGTMNYPTEWYCERCGGELAAL